MDAFPYRRQKRVLGTLAGPRLLGVRVRRCVVVPKKLLGAREGSGTDREGDSNEARGSAFTANRDRREVEWVSESQDDLNSMNSMNIEVGIWGGTP